MVIALAGRRIDAEGGSPARFPLKNVDAVARSVRRRLEAERATALVSSAACGADLVALREAGALKLRRRIVLPFDRKRFRESSVIDRPGDWGGLFDTIVDEVAAAGDLIVLGGQPGTDAAYAAANDAILDEAQAIARASGEEVGALLVWDGTSRGEGDLTQAFGDSARARHIRTIDVQTL